MAGSTNNLLTRLATGLFGFRGAPLILLAVAPLCGGPASAQPLPGPGLQPAGDVAQGNVGAGEATAATVGAHPLEPALELANRGLAQLRTTIKDYSATVVKRERIDGKLGEHQYIFAKIRHEPFSVYLYFLAPDEVKGQEVIYVEGRNDGNMLAHAGSGVRAMVGTVSLKPNGAMAMQGNRYAITEIGVENLSRRLVPRCDLLVLVADPSRRGLETMARIHSLALEMGLEYSRLALVVNRTADGSPPDYARELQTTIQADLLLPLPWDQDLAALAEEGHPLHALPPNNPVWQSVDALLALL